MLSRSVPNLNQALPTQPRFGNWPRGTQCLQTTTRRIAISLKSRYNERLRQRAITVRRARRKRICESTICWLYTIFLIANVETEIRNGSSLQCDRPFLSCIIDRSLDSQFVTDYTPTTTHSNLRIPFTPLSASSDAFCSSLSHLQVTLPRPKGISGKSMVSKASQHVLCIAEDLTHLPLRGSFI